MDSVCVWWGLRYQHTEAKFSRIHCPLYFRSWVRVGRQKWGSHFHAPKVCAGSRHRGSSHMSSGLCWPTLLTWGSISLGSWARYMCSSDKGHQLLPQATCILEARGRDIMWALVVLMSSSLSLTAYPVFSPCWPTVTSVPMPHAEARVLGRLLHQVPRLLQF